MMKTNAKLPPQFYSKSRRKLTKRCATWGRRLLFAGLLLLVFQLVRYLYAKPGLSYVALQKQRHVSKLLGCVTTFTMQLSSIGKEFMQWKLILE